MPNSVRSNKSLRKNYREKFFMIYNQKRNAKIKQMILKGKKKNMIEVE